jgi:neutral ceramidase
MKRKWMVAAAWLVCGLVEGAPLQGGLAAIDITPPVGWRMSGYFYERLSTGVHDPLQAKALALRQGDERAILVFCDLIGVPAQVSSAVRTEASRKTGVPAANIMIAATHTHTGPLYYGALRQYFHDKAVRENGKDSFEAVNYREILEARLVALILQANRSLQPIELQVARTNLTGLSFNRRYRMRDGSVQFNPGKTNRNILQPAGPVNPDLFLVAIKGRRDHPPLGLLTSFALHPDTIGGTEYGADFPGHLDRFLKGLVSAPFVSIFANGPCGDINHINVEDPSPQKGDRETARIGEAIGKRAMQAFPSLRKIEGAPLRVASGVVEIPLQHYTAEQALAAQRNIAKIGGKDLPFLEQVQAYKIADLQLRNSAVLRAEVQAFRLGADTAIVALPGEIFTELGVAIKRGSPFGNTIVVELANDSIGYVPTKTAFREGSYEVVNSRVQPGGGELLVKTALGLLRELSISSRAR